MTTNATSFGEARGQVNENAGPDRGYLTVPEAARMLQVSVSTMWRWISAGQVRAYRFGSRRVRLSEHDVLRLIRPARGEKGAPDPAEGEQRALAEPSSQSEREQALKAIEAAARIQQRLLARRGGQRFSSSTELLTLGREERAQQLG